MSDKMQITFDPIRKDRLLSHDEAMKELYKFYEDLMSAGFTQDVAVEILVRIMTGQGRK